ncbi:MAG: MFS transporter [Phycisphaerales bacterium]|nr:MAG: MFS transporter [Phycisphaerales bacterium]
MPPAPRIFPGYTVAAASTVAFIATAPGQTMLVSQLNLPLREAFGIDELTLNASYTIATVLASFPLVLVGALTDRFGPRRMIALIALVYGLGCLVMAGAQGFVTVFLAFFLLRFLGQGALALASQHAVAMWFHRKLGRVHGVKQVIVFGVWSVFPPLSLLLIESMGWRWTYALFALLIWVTVIPVALVFIRNKPEDLGLNMDNDPPDPAADPSFTTPPDPTSVGPNPPRQSVKPREPAFTLKQASRTRAYWTLAAAFFLAPLIGTGFLFDMQPILAQRGLGAGVAAAAVSVWTITMAVMALPGGVLVDKVRPSALISVGMGMIALSSVLLWIASSAVGAGAAMAAFAVGQSLVASCGTATAARYFGRTHHGRIRSSLTRIGVIGTGLGTLFTGVSASLTGGYEGAMLAFVILCVPVVLLAMSLDRPEEPTRDGAEG